MRIPVAGRNSRTLPSEAMRTDDQQLLEEFHQQIRLRGREDGPSPGIVQDTDGPVLRRYPEVPGSSYCTVESPHGLGDTSAHSRPIMVRLGLRDVARTTPYVLDARAG